MFYWEQPESKLYASIAERLGKILQQYETLNPPDTEKYQATLILCVLQNLLTQFSENKSGFFIKKAINHYERRISVTQILKELNIEEKFVTFNTFKFTQEQNNETEHITPINFYAHLRNALSHPAADATNLDKDLNKDKITTGYTAIEKNGQISKYIFWDAPPKGKHAGSIYRIELTIQELNNVTVGLINLLSSPLKEKEFDGSKILRIFKNKAA